MMIRTMGMILALAALTTACGNSPFFHHLNADHLNLSPTEVAASACPLSLPQAGLCGSVTWDAPVSSGDAAAFSLHFWNAQTGNSQGPYIDPANTVFVQLWMPEMGHGSSPVSILKSAAGVYEVSRVYFIMAGAWELRIQLKSGQQVVEQAVLPVSVP